MKSIITKMIAGGCLLGLAGCMMVPADFIWGDNASQWANDGDCDDPRFTGPMAHTLLLPEDALHDANDCRALFLDGKVQMRSNYQQGVTYENPGYVGPN